MTDWENSFLCSFWLVHLIIYVVLNDFGVWGDGDSDLFLLMGNLCLVPRFSDCKKGQKKSSGNVFFSERFFLFSDFTILFSVFSLVFLWYHSHPP